MSVQRDQTNGPALPSADQALTMEQVEKQFITEQGSRLQALLPIDLAIEAGEFVSIIGPSGCGKSTLLRLVANIDQPSAGQIRVMGLTPQEAQAKQLIGFVFQNPVMLPWRDVLANTGFALEVTDVPKKEREAKARESLQRVDLDGFERARPDQLSGGMQQRVAVARMLALQPKILLMDEPFSALDELTREKISLDLGGIIDRTDTTVVMVTHNIEEAVLLSDRVVALSARPGRIQAEFTVPLPRPRRSGLREHSTFVQLTTEIRKLVMQREGLNHELATG